MAESCPAGQAAKTPPLLFLHGFAQSAATWNEVRARLSDFPTATLDWPGHGSDKDNHDHASYALAAAADLLAAKLRRLHGSYPDHPLPIAIGYSMGGRLLATAIQLWQSQEPAADNPVRLLGGIVLESAGLGPVDETDRAVSAERNRQWAEHLRRDGIEAFIDYWETLPLFATQAGQPKKRKAQLRAERLANDPEALALSLEEAGVHRMPPQAEVIDSLVTLAGEGIPVLFLAGAEDRRYRDLAATLSAQLNTDLPISTEIVATVGHNIHYEAPERFAELLRTFATQVASSPI